MSMTRHMAQCLLKLLLLLLLLMMTMNDWVLTGPRAHLVGVVGFVIAVESHVAGRCMIRVVLA